MAASRATELLAAHLQPLVDQACAAVVCYKLHRLTITLPVLSLDFWRYLPACLFSDLVAVATLQALSRLTANGLRKGSTRRRSHGYRSLHDVAGAHGRTGSFSSIFSGSDEHLPEDECLPHHANSEKGWTEAHAPSRLPWKSLWLALAVLLVFISFSQNIFAVLAIGAFRAGDIVVSWKDALSFEAEGRTDYLVASAIKSWYCFAGAYLAIFSLARLARWLAGSQETLPPKKLSALSWQAWLPRILLLLVVIVPAAVFRPPKALASNDLLWEGIQTSAILLAGKAGLVHPQTFVFQANSTLYGKSNIFEPRVTPLDEIRHVFFISLESADGLAWPYSPKYCEHRNCKDIPEEYNNVDHMTPYFKSLIEKENVFFTSEYKANIAYTAKSHFGMACGQLPEYKNFVINEIAMDPPLPCLPDVLRAADPAFRSAHWTSQDHDWDHYDVFVEKAGYDVVYGRQQLEQAFLKQGIKWPQLTNWFGYSEEDTLPYFMEWVDERVANGERVFATLPGNAMHHDFGVPPDSPMELHEYTKNSEDVSKYLNTVRWTDHYIQVFFEALEKRGLLDNSLVILAGDHGPRIDEQGVYHTMTGWQDSGIYQVPLLVHAPGLRSIKQPRQHFLNMDLMPTILDAIGVKPEAIAKYTGHSIFRNVGQEYDRVTFHSQNPGGNGRHVTRKQADANYKAVYFDDTGDTCATDLYVDETEEIFYCVQEGWRKVNIANKLEDGLTLGLWKAGSPEETALIAWAHEGKDLLHQHFALNAQQWNTSEATNHQIAHQELLAFISSNEGVPAQ